MTAAELLTVTAVITAAGVSVIEMASFVSPRAAPTITASAQVIAQKRGLLFGAHPEYERL
jgi:hypothetical protein